MAVLLNLTCSSKSPPIYSRVIDVHSGNKFVELLSYENWEAVFSNDNINIIFNSFLNTYLRIFQFCFPVKKKPAFANFKPWLTHGIKISCTNKKKLYEIFNCNKDPRFNLYYKKYCKILKSTIEASKRKYYDNLISISTNKSKTTWNIVRTITNKRDSQNKITSMNINSHLIQDPDIIANSFNSFFSSVAQNLTQQPSGNNPKKEPIQNLYSNNRKPMTLLHLDPTSAHEINKIIQSLKTKDSHGYDEISSRILKISTPCILSPLTYIFNKVLHSGIFPDRMKFSVIKPLHKKGTTKEFENYRPISLLTFFFFKNFRKNYL
jgi:hypothetical protein